MGLMMFLFGFSVAALIAMASNAMHKTNITIKDNSIDNIDSADWWKHGRQELDADDE